MIVATVTGQRAASVSGESEADMIPYTAETTPDSASLNKGFPVTDLPCESEPKPTDCSLVQSKVKNSSKKTTKKQETKGCSRNVPIDFNDGNATLREPVAGVRVGGCHGHQPRQMTWFDFQERKNATSLMSLKTEPIRCAMPNPVRSLLDLSINTPPHLAHKKQVIFFFIE